MCLSPINPLNPFSMSVINIYRNEALQYHDALSIALVHLESEYNQFIDRAPYNATYMSDGDLSRIETLDKSKYLIQKLINQIESGCSIPLKQES